MGRPFLAVTASVVLTIPSTGPRCSRLGTHAGGCGSRSPRAGYIEVSEHRRELVLTDPRAAIDGIGAGTAVAVPAKLDHVHIIATLRADPVSGRTRPPHVALVEQCERGLETAGTGAPRLLRH